MANPEHLAVLRQGVAAWNEWRQVNPDIRPDLRGADLCKADLREAHLHGADLFKADLRKADLSRADLSRAYLVSVNLGAANLCVAGFGWADLSKADLSRTNLYGADFGEANLHGVNLSEADLSRACLVSANLSGANLHGANLFLADLSSANLFLANLREADLDGTLLGGTTLLMTNLHGAKLHNTKLDMTIFSDINLAGVKGLDACNHGAISYLDFRTLQQSGPLPLTFLRGCGLPDLLIDYLPSLLNQPIQFYSCFISYSSKDEDFAQRLHADLQNKGVRCWFAPKDIQGGRKLYEQISEAIQLQDRLLLVLSEHSMNSECEWVRTEIAKARQREVREKRRVLFPIRLVDFKTIQDWECFDADTGKDSAKEIREYFIPDFSNWKSHEAYQQAFDRLLRDLKPELERKPETS